ncbi:MAG: ethanolamine ammonia-lyase subunit EutB [Bilophila wadsworthia]
MKLKTTLFGETYRFDSVRDVLNKAGELRSGDVLAGVAASSMQERVAAKQVLSELTLGDLREHPVVPYEDDAVTRIIQDAVHTPVLREHQELVGRGVPGISAGRAYLFRRH